MNSFTLEVVFIVLLILANGMFAMSEIAIVSARKARLQQLAEEGRKGADVALELANSPNRLLSTVQIGITLVGIFAGAFGGATVAESLEMELRRFPLIAPYGGIISMGLVVLGITYLSLVLGELAPKRLALNNAEPIACAVAPIMRRLSILASPFVHVLGLSTEMVLRLLGMKHVREAPVTEEEIKILIEQGTRGGVFEPAEQKILERVFRLGDRPVHAIMTPRPEVIRFDVSEPPEEIRRKIAESGRTRFPVGQGSPDNLLGVVEARDLLLQALSGREPDLRAVMRPTIFVLESMSALKVLERFKETHSHAAIVIDEYGGFQGLVTITDILEAMVGDMPPPDDDAQPEVVQREDGSWLLDGKLLADELKEILKLENLPFEDEGHYQTLGGLVMTAMGRVPTTGDHFDCCGLRFEVVDMDGRRVDKVLVSSVPHSAMPSDSP